MELYKSCAIGPECATLGVVHFNRGAESDAYQATLSDSRRARDEIHDDALARRLSRTSLLAGAADPQRSCANAGRLPPISARRAGRPRDMFLALAEIRRNRSRFLLIVAIIALITALTLFIAALADGLGTGNIQGLQKLDADLLVFQEKSDSP